jgi:type II secretory pathway pseudopilin PulG
MARTTQPFPARPQRRQRGVVLIGLLLVMALSGMWLMAAVDLWTLVRQREREQELLFAGDAYRQAIRQYYFGAPPGVPRSLPRSLEVLLEDDRYPRPVHHLRRLYPDPMTGSTQWGERRLGDFLVGVYSLSEAPPIKQAGFAAADAGFEDKRRYKDWVFTFAEAPGVPSPLGAPSRSPNAPPELLAPAPGTRSLK